MKFPKKSKAEKVVSKDQTKRVLLNPYLDARDSGKMVLIANSKGVVAFPAVDAGEVGDLNEDVVGPIPLDAVKASRKHDEEIILTRDYADVGGVQYPRNGTNLPAFPPLDQLFVSKEDAQHEVSLDVKRLYEIAQAMGTDVVRLRLPADPKMPIGVEPELFEDHIDGARGAIMPYDRRQGV